MPDIKVSRKDLTGKGESFSETVSRTDMEDQYFRSTVRINSRTAFWEPLFLIIISIMGILSREIVFIKIFNSTVYTLALFFLLRLSSDYAPRGKMRILIWVFLSFLPLNLIYNQKIMSEALFFALFTLLICFIERSSKKKNMDLDIPGTILVGFLLALSFLTKSQSLLILFPVILLRYFRNGLKPILILFFVFLVLISPWIIRNYMVFDTLVLMPTKSAVTIWARNNPIFLYQDQVDDNLNSLERLALNNALKNRALYNFPEIKGEDEISRYKQIRENFFRMLKNNPSNYMIMVSIRASLLFRVPLKGNMGLFISVLLLFSISAVIISNIFKGRLLFANISLLLFIIFSVLVNADTRFRVPLDPFFALSVITFIHGRISAGTILPQGK